MHEDPFRYPLIAIYAIQMSVALVYRIRSQLTGERLDRRQEGIFIMVTLRLAGLAVMVGLITYMINPDWMAWSSFPLADWLRWAGIGIAAAGGVLMIWTLHSLGRNLTDTVVTRREHTLVTAGPYRWVRHPFYLSIGASCLAGVLVPANWFLAACALALILLIVKRTSKEEENLVRRFGDDYRAYMRRTGRFFPRPTRLRAGQS